MLCLACLRNDVQYLYKAIWEKIELNPKENLKSSYVNRYTYNKSMCHKALHIDNKVLMFSVLVVLCARVYQLIAGQCFTISVA